MGELFSQMATLIMQQSETVSRIEDDVSISGHIWNQVIIIIIILID